MSDKNVDKAIELGMKSKYLEGVLDGIAASTNGLHQALQSLGDETLKAMTKRELLESAIRSIQEQRSYFETELKDVLEEFDELRSKTGDGEVLQ